MALDPESEIDVVESAFDRKTDLRQDRERAERALRLCGVEIRIDGRKAAGAEVGNCHRDQAMILAELDQARRAPRGVEESREILGPRIVHSAAGMARLQISPVERKVLVA